MPECGSTFQRTSPAPFTVWLLGLWIPAVSEQELKGQPHHGGSALEAVTTSPMDATIFQVNELPAHRRKGKIKRWCPCLQISRSSGWQLRSPHSPYQTGYIGWDFRCPHNGCLGDFPLVLKKQQRSPCSAFGGGQFLLSLCLAPGCFGCLRHWSLDSPSYREPSSSSQVATETQAL
ncbi:uncharacterized protein [Gorilla gorilla gorilla]|uniref:uncharacterized protein isoform X3 n=1 Tax=Gorilla gorilla gorilla TaxID=9595 RepID=UPI0030094713